MRSLDGKLMLVIFATLIGVGIGLALGQFRAVPKMGNGAESAQKEPKILYWVAPMDANYRRDQPGLSPMGMDLVPVYEEAEGSKTAEKGTITISPDVINNLGVRTGKVAYRALHSEIVTVGYVKFDEDKLIHIHPRISGWVEKLYVKAAGDPVSKDEPLYSLYSPELVSAQDDLLLAMDRGNKRLVEASKNRLRALKISEPFIVDLQRERKIKQTVIFYSPQSGVVDNLNIREGFFVQPGTTMLSVGSLDQVWVEAEIFERQASLVKTNDSVTMTLDYLPGRIWTGVVEYIYPTLDQKNRTVRIRIRFDNNDNALKPNMFAQVVISSDRNEKQLVIPREALIRTGSQDRVVLALGAGFFKSVEVKVGRLNQNFAEILEGLEEGNEVVTSAQFLLDSESSKTSDFNRMHHEADTQRNGVSYMENRND